MKIKDILKPKNKKEVEEEIINLLKETPNVPEFINNNREYFDFRSLKIFHKIVQKIGTNPADIFLVFQKNPIFKLIEHKIERDIVLLASKRLKSPLTFTFTAGPFSTGHYYKGTKYAILSHSTARDVIIIDLDLLLELI
jgi:hypothetical protein